MDSSKRISGEISAMFESNSMVTAGAVAGAAAATSDSKKRGRFGRLLRRGTIYTAAIAIGITLAAPATSMDYLPPAMPKWMSKETVPEYAYLTTAKLYYNEAKNIAESSYAESGKYDLDSLREIQKGYFQFLKYKHVDSETPMRPFMPLIRKAVDADITTETHDGKIDSKIISGIMTMAAVSIMSNESWGFQYTVGKDGELGLMQIDPHVHKLTKDQYAHIFDPETNIQLGVKIFSNYLIRFHYDIAKTIEAYNGGTRNVIYGRVSEGAQTYLKNAMRHIREMDRGKPQ